MALLGEERTAAVLAAAADPLLDTIREIAAEAGVSEGAAAALVKRLRTKGLLLGRALGDVTRDETKKLYDYRALQILQSISEKDIENASLYQKMTSAAIATDKGLLLDGQPTQILSVKQLDNLDLLAENLLNEIKRRGMAMRAPELPDGGEPGLDGLPLPANRVEVYVPQKADGTQPPGQFRDPARRLRRSEDDPTPKTQLP